MESTTDVMKQIEDLLGVHQYGLDTVEFMTITASVEFEPHGRASETSEVIYRVRFPGIPYMWKSINGWHKGSATAGGMIFSGRTLDATLRQAASALQEIIPLLSASPSKR